MNKIITYCHIPKTGGTTLNFLLQKNYGATMLNALSMNNNNYELKELERDIIIYRKLHCISSHAVKPFINYGNYSDRLAWFTIIRNPIKRYISQYIHQYTGDFDRYKIPIEKWANKFNRKNFIVRWIAGEENFNKAIDIINSKFFFVGLLENFYDSLKYLNRNFKLNLDLKYRNKKMVTRNKGLKHNLMTEDYDKYKDLYEEQNDLDLKLYNYVERNFHKNQGTISKEYNFNHLNTGFFNGYVAFRVKQILLYKSYLKLNSFRDI